MIEVEYRSRGCFHNFVNIFMIRGNYITMYDVTLEVSMLDGDPVIRDRTKVGSLELEESEIEGLDSLFAYYDGDLRGGCTTVENVTFRLIRNGVEVNRKVVTDYSCSLFDKENYLRGCFEILSMAFQSICRRLSDVEMHGIAPLCPTFLPR